MLVLLGVLGVLACAALMVYGLLLREMSADKKLSESAITLLIAAWCAGFVVAGWILRRP